MIIALQTLVYFREALLTALDRALRPYYKRFSLAFSAHGEESEEEEPEEQVFSEFDDDRGVIFFPPMYAQRYAAVTDCLLDERWRGQLEKVVDFGYHDMSFIKYLKEVAGVQHILGVDIESIPLRCSSDLFGCEDYGSRRENPLRVTLFQGNAADPDYRLIGCDAVVAIEMIEHMLPHDLDRLVHTVFGFIKPWIVVFTTPNGDFNVLFKALENNGLRRLDHFFEWSREQFHDWCSNIVVRYPLFEVTCQGIGPGPPGTLHYGCCSQLALFVNKDYQKQQDLNLNSLVLVQETPNANANNAIDSWASTDSSIVQPDLSSPTAITSFTELLHTTDQSCVTLTTVTPTTYSSRPSFPIFEEEDSLGRSDKILQCNLDTDFGKSFLMFDEDVCADVRMARKMVYNRVYEIEDVASRLNCTTLQVKKFSKTTQNMMARNKIDSLVHTREVVDEIRHLTKTLNINKCITDRQEENANIWCNINWGDNAPYWNQYYKVVKDYNYPFETKSDDCRILDLISDEINRKIDKHFDQEPSSEVNRLEIPMSHLMTVVQHITDDVDTVRNLLEWNGYEIVEDVVIHSRLVLDAASVATHEEDWQDNDTNSSEWDNITEVRSTTLSETSTIVPDYHDRCLRHALDDKVRNLRKMLTADEDITTELDRVVCKLMKLALRTSKGRTTPPPAKWMQCKLLDLLTLTEKAIERRKKHLIENSLKAIEFGSIKEAERKRISNSNETIEDNIVKEIVNKYRHIISSTDTSAKAEIDGTKRHYSDTEPMDDLMSTTTIEFMKDLEYSERRSPSLVVLPSTCGTKACDTPRPQTAVLNSIERTKAWLNGDVEAVPSPQDMNYENFSSADTDSMSSFKHRPKRAKHMPVVDTELETATCMTSPSRTSSNKYKSKREDKKRKTSSTRVTKKVARKISGHYNIVKNSSSKYPTVDYQNCIMRQKRRDIEHRCLTMRASKPIPESLIDLCHPELKVEKCLKEFNVLNNVDEANNIMISNQSSPEMFTDKNVLRGMIINDTQENENLQKIMDNDVDIADKDQIELLSYDLDVNLCTRHEVSTENIFSQTIFLNDINEPSTSKGIRHNVSMDVQCGPDALAAYPMLSASTSLVRIPPVFSAGIKILDRLIDTKGQGIDFGTTTRDTGNDKIITPRSRSVGIKIKDSDVNICATIENYTMTQATSGPRYINHGERSWSPDQTRSPVPRSWSPESNVIAPEKHISSISKTAVDFGSEFNMSVGSLQKSSEYSNTSDSFLINPSEYRENRMIQQFSNVKYSKPKLCCGGIHVHSYKDRQISEDIVYQGEWQRYKTKSIRKKTHNSIVCKKITESGNRKQKDTAKEKKVNSKEKMLVKKPETKVDHRKPQPIRNVRLAKEKQATRNAPNKWTSNPPKTDSFIPNTVRPQRPFNNVTKVASKIAMRPTTAKNVKSAFTAKKPQITSTISDKKDGNAKGIKSYIPLYMRRKNAEMANKSNLNKSIDSATVELQQEGNEKNISETDEIRKDLLNFRGKMTKDTYMVYCNKQESNSASSTDPKTVNTATDEDDTKKNNGCIERALSPQSLNSSTCSSLNSIATVRAVSTKYKNSSNRRHSTSSHRSNLNTSESDNPTPTKPKKVLKKFKNPKRSDSDKGTNNKENIPETTENFASKEPDKLAKSPFLGQHKSVCIAQLKTELSSVTTTTDTLSKHRTPNKSNIQIPMSKDTVDKEQSHNAILPRKKSLKCETSSVNSIKVSNQDNNISYGSPECANMVLVLNPQELLSESQNVTKTESVVNSVENSALNEWLQNSRYDSDMNHMRRLIDELLDYIDFESVINSRTMVLSLDDEPGLKVAMNESACSFKTVTADYFNKTFLRSDFENSSSLNRTFDSCLGDESIISLMGTRMTGNDLDSLSYKSISPVSKHSEYFLADREFDTTADLVEQTDTPSAVINPTSVTDIFERREPRIVQTTPGLIANQAFSGFSLDGEPVTGDQLDPVALVDSETGSLATGMARQATSEEVYISGRSSESYASCIIDEDAVVPNWLFQIISQQQSEVVENQPMIGPQPMMAEPLYDVNGNTTDVGMMGVAAGAGDGRGIHSDQSQDSSGRGTSLSSSDTSSSRQSEVILMDSSGFTAQFELIQDPMDSSVLTQAESVEVNSRNENFRSIEEADSITLMGHSRRRPRLQLNASSDIDADISSIDTDVPDSSDN